MIALLDFAIENFFAVNKCEGQYVPGVGWERVLIFLGGSA